MADDNKQADESTEDDGVMDDLGGIFGVSSGKKKKKKKKKSTPEPASAIEEAEDDDADEPEVDLVAESDSDEPEVVDIDASDDDDEVEPVAASPAKAKKKKKKASDEVAGLFTPGSDDTPIEDIEIDDPYLSEEDLGDIKPSGPNRTVLAMGAVIGVLVLALGYVALSGTDFGGKVGVLFTEGVDGVRQREFAKARKAEEDFRQKQIEALDIFGNLTVTGTPLYATLKINGETYYGQTSAGHWRELQITNTGTTLSNLKVKEKHAVEVSAPGFSTKKIDLSRGMWPEPKGGLEGGGTWSHQVNATLVPNDPWSKLEYDARMGSDTENEYYGSVTIQSNPPGAAIEFNGKPLVDKGGNPLKTPATISAYYTQDEKSKKLKENPVRVDTLFDNGHKIVIKMEGKPSYVNELNRQMWTCIKKDDKAIKKLKKDHSIQQECDYSFNIMADLDGIARFKKSREEEMKRIREKNKKIQEELLKENPDAKAAPAGEQAKN